MFSSRAKSFWVSPIHHEDPIHHMKDVIHNSLGSRRCIISFEKHPPDIWCHLCDSKPSQKTKGDDILQKNYVHTDPSYFVTLGQAHLGWISGAVAELVDNLEMTKNLGNFIYTFLLFSQKSNISKMQINFPSSFGISVIVDKLSHSSKNPS
jgi:hypothetical protein